MRTRMSMLSTLICLLATACTAGGPAPEGQQELVGPAGSDFPAPSRHQLARGVKLGDQTSQHLSMVAADGDILVAIGVDNSANTSRPLVLRSNDAGATWQRVDLPVPDGWENREFATVDAFTHGPAGFLALASDDESRKVAWQSIDGVTWKSLPMEEDQFSREDFAYSLTTIDSSYVALGANSLPAGRATSRPMMWRSEDGASWERIDLSDHGISGYRGTFSPTDIVEHRGRLVIAGTHEDNNDAEQPNRVAIWRSDDDARSFVADKLPRAFAGDFRAYTQDLEVEGRSLYLLASGDAPGQSTGSWDGVIMAQERGRWTAYSPAAFSSSAEEHPDMLLRAKGNWLATGSSDGSDAILVTGSSVPGLTGRRHDTFTGPRSQVISAAVATGSGFVLVGWSDTRGADTPRIWRVDGSTITPAKLPEDPEGTRPSTYPASLVRFGRRPMALGNVAGSPVSWGRNSDGVWVPEGLPGHSTAVESVSVSAVAANADGGLVAVGSESRKFGGEQAVWVRDPGSRSWRQVLSTAFAKASEGGFGSVWATDVAITNQAVVTAGGAHANGLDEVYPTRAMPHGNQWTVGRGTGYVPNGPSDDYMARTPYRDFRAPVNGSITMETIEGRGRVFVAAGGRTEPGKGQQPWYWRSVDAGRSWAKGKPLETPTGAHAAVAHASATSIQGDMVFIGAVSETADDETDSWVSWWTEDLGRSWKLGETVEGDSNVSEVVAVPGGYVAMGSTSDEGDTTAAAWLSTDGLRWSPIELEGERFAGPGEQRLQTGLVDGEVIRVIAVDVPPQGGGYYATEIPLP